MISVQNTYSIYIISKSKIMYNYKHCLYIEKQRKSNEKVRNCSIICNERIEIKAD